MEQKHRQTNNSSCIAQVILGVILFVSAGTILWPRAWVFMASGLSVLLFNLVVIPAEVIEERGRSKKDAKTWDKLITSLNIIPSLLMVVTCGLDFRFGWTGKIPAFIPLAGLIFYIFMSLLFTWAMVANTFFSTLVRLQFDRHHKVASGGPYRFVRHPGYLAYMLFTLATPVALGTLWGLVFALGTVKLLVLRTALEDSALKKELPGYTDYAERVRYKLVRGIW